MREVDIATATLEALIKEAKLPADTRYRREPDDDDDPYYAFVVYISGPYPGADLFECRVLVPPVHADRLRGSMKRLYIDGSSWTWEFAPEWLNNALKEEEES